ncbi:hypothetical protein C0584_05545 [Candidatus Parcubacteria bacterium]|nr:MAG: hypothetical protein C0584_05545 [Candidatus Parcubacteria bacterium]
MEIYYSDDLKNIEMVSRQEKLAKLCEETITHEKRINDPRISESRKKRIARQKKLLLTIAIPRITKQLHDFAYR